MNDICVILSSLLEQGLQKMTLLLRHAERSSDIQNSKDEPLVPLTQKGKKDAYEFGLVLSSWLRYRFFSSIRPRCIEAAYQIEKGCIEQGASTTVNEIAPLLSPSFFIDYDKATSAYAAKGPEYFYQSWLNGLLPEDIIQQPKPVLLRLTEWLSSNLYNTESHCVNVAVTHDCHIYLLRHLGLKRGLHEFSEVRYLEGIVVFDAQGKLLGIDDRGIPISLL